MTSFSLVQFLAALAEFVFKVWYLCVIYIILANFSQTLFGFDLPNPLDAVAGP